MILPLNQIVNTLEETKLLASNLSKLFRFGDIVVINGNLGAGKTTLIKNICEEYKISNVTSPSFSLINEYYGSRKIYHFDFYRLNKVEELYDIGFEDYLNDEEAILFIEWGNLMEEIIPVKHFEIQINLLSDQKRQFNILKKY